MRVPRPDLSEALGSPDACTRCHDDRTTRWSNDAVERWFGPREVTKHYGPALDAGRAGDPAAESQLIVLATDATQSAIVRGTALSLLRPSARTTPLLRAALDSPEPLVRVGAVQALVGADRPAIAALAVPALDDEVAAVRVQAARLVAVQPGASWGPDALEAIDRAIAGLERLQLLRAAESSSWVMLGDLYAGQQRIGEAREAYETALALDSTDLAATLNLADLLRALGSEDAGEQVLLAALRYHGESAELLHAIGLLRIRQGRADQATDWLARAAAAGRDRPRFAYVYAVALASGGDVPGGVEILDAALVDHPFDRDLLSALVSYNRELDRPLVALEHAERLLEVTPDDPAARSTVGQLREATRRE